MSANETPSPGSFHKMHAAGLNPWQFVTSEYERTKYEATVAALPKLHFEHAFEIGCSIGILTGLLAQRCSKMMAVDVSDAALHKARKRLHAQPNVQLQRMVVPQDFPEGDFDLVVLSEVGYDWSPAELTLASQLITQALRPGATLVMVHWASPVHGFPLTGDAVHEHFMGLSGEQRPLRHVHASRQTTYRLDVFERCGTPSA